MAEYGLRHGHAQSWNAREIAQRALAAGQPLSPVMQAAVTACELAHAPAAREAERQRH